MADKLVGFVTPWARGELEDAIGTDIDCGSSAFYETDEGQYYVTDVTVYGSGTAHIEGTLYIDGASGERWAMAIRIESANSADELPEGLADGDEDIRELAREKLEELGESLGTIGIGGSG